MTVDDVGQYGVECLRQRRAAMASDAPHHDARIVTLGHVRENRVIQLVHHLQHEPRFPLLDLVVGLEDQLLGRVGGGACRPGLGHVTVGAAHAQLQRKPRMTWINESRPMCFGRTLRFSNFCGIWARMAIDNGFGMHWLPCDGPGGHVTVLLGIIAICPRVAPGHTAQ